MLTDPADAPPPATGRPRRRRRLPPLRVDAVTAARLFGVGLRTWRALDAAGRVPRPHRLSARVLWDYRELRAWSAAGMPPRAEWELTRRQRR